VTDEGGVSVYHFGMSESSRFQLVARPTLRGKGAAGGGIAHVEFRASCDGQEERVWRIEEWYLSTLFDIIESRQLVTETLCELRDGRPVRFPGDYSGTQLVLLGYRMAIRKPPQSAFVLSRASRRYARR
jgi:hypothetical protein